MTHSGPIGINYPFQLMFPHSNLASASAKLHLMGFVRGLSCIEFITNELFLVLEG
jgi:hypothetical protein